SSGAFRALQGTKRDPAEPGLPAYALGLRGAIRGRLPNPWARSDVHAAISLGLLRMKEKRGHRCVDGRLKHNSGHPRMPPGVRDRADFRAERQTAAEYHGAVRSSMSKSSLALSNLRGFAIVMV